MWKYDVVARHHGQAANASAASSSSSAKTAIASIAPRCRHPWQLLPPKDACGEESLIDNVVIEKATSDEVDNSPDPGDGNTVNDIVVASDCKSVEIMRRARRDKGWTSLSGDAAGERFIRSNVTHAVYKVSVPVGKKAAVNSGVAYTVTGSCGP